MKNKLVILVILYAVNVSFLSWSQSWEMTSTWNDSYLSLIRVHCSVIAEQDPWSVCSTKGFTTHPCPSFRCWVAASISSGIAKVDFHVLVEFQYSTIASCIHLPVWVYFLVFFFFLYLLSEEELFNCRDISCLLITLLFP